MSERVLFGMILVMVLWTICTVKNYFNKLKFYSVKRKSVHVLVIVENMDNMHGEKLEKKTIQLVCVKKCHRFLSAGEEILWVPKGVRDI